MGMQPVRVGISGSYGGLNLGDEAILEVIVRQLQVSMPAEITVFSRDTEDTLRRHDVDHAVPIRQRRTSISKITIRSSPARRISWLLA